MIPVDQTQTSQAHFAHGKRPTRQVTPPIDTQLNSPLAWVRIVLSDPGADNGRGDESTHEEDEQTSIPSANVIERNCNGED